MVNKLREVNQHPSLLQRIVWNKLRNDVPPNSLMDSTTSLKMKTTKGEEVGSRSLARNTSGVEGRVGAPGWGLGRLTSKLITHTDLHQPNNKLVNA